MPARLLRDKRLYRSTHRTFEEYARARFGFNRSRSYQFIDAATVVDNLKCPRFVGILPTSEWQIRPLTSLEPDQQRQVWQEAVEKAGGKIPSGRIVKSIVQQKFGQKPDTSFSGPTGNGAEPNCRRKPELFTAEQVSEKIPRGDRRL